MKSSLIGLAAGAALAAVAVLGTAGTPAETGASGAAAHGKALFMQDGCYTCHGTVGQGNRFSGIAIAPHPVPYAAFIKQLRTPFADMPPYAANVVSEADAQAIYAYLESIPGGKPAADLPLLKAAAARDVPK